VGPAVVLPQGGDQYRNAEILSAAGAASTCTSDAVDDLTAAIGQGLASWDLTERAATIADDNAAMPDITELAHHLTALDF
jgi:UDP:flavonoid glycosyltransferase YjiC (YdhE family)